MARRMVFGDDGSSSADSAWLWVNSHSWPEWEIEVVNVDGEAAPIPREPIERDSSVHIKHTRLEGKPAERLRELAADSDIIVVGAKGRDWRNGRHIGSTAESLMHCPPAPLAIIRGGHRTKRILLAIDGSKHARAAEESVVRLPWIGSAEVGIVGIREEGNDPREVWEAEKRMSSIAKYVTAQVLGPDDPQDFNPPSDTILDAAKNWNADLVALGSRGLSRWEEPGEAGLCRPGSSAISVARQASCSVMLAEAAS